MLTSYVYFVQAGTDGPVRIGTSTRVAHDLNMIQAELPFQLQVLRITRGDRSLEGRLHKALSEYCLRGDWYEPSGPLMNLISSFEDVSHELGVFSSPPTYDIADLSSSGSLLDKVTPHVYVVRVPSGAIRIGFSWNLESHLKLLQEAVPETLETVTVLECVPSIVDELCAELEPHRIHGQWFKPDLEVQLAIDTLPDRVAHGMGIARFYGGRELAISSGESVKYKAHWLAEDLDHVYRRAHAQFGSVVHLKSGAVVPRYHMTVVEAQDVLREEVEQNKDHVESVCLFRRSLNNKLDPECGVWVYHVSVGSCPGGCASLL